MGSHSRDGSQKPSPIVEEKNQPGTLYDRVLTKILNNKFAVAVLFAFVVLAALPKIYPTLSLIKNVVSPGKNVVSPGKNVVPPGKNVVPPGKNVVPPGKPGFKVITYIRQYDFMVGDSQSAHPISRIEGDTSQVSSIAKDIAKDIANACGPRPDKLEATIEIQGNTLHSSQSLRAAVIYYQNPVVQAGRVTKDLGERDDIDMEPFFTGAMFVNPHKKSVDMELEPSQGGFESVPLRVYKQAQGYSFDPQKQDQMKTISFSSRKLKIILEGYKSSGQGLDKIQNSLESELRADLAGYSFLEISQYSLADLEKKRLEIQHLPPQPGKSMVSNQVGVDYIISGDLNSE